MPKSPVKDSVTVVEIVFNGFLWFCIAMVLSFFDWLQERAERRRI